MIGSHALVEEHFAGRSSPARDRRMWDHLPGCDRCRARYRALAMLESLEPDGGARARDRMATAVFAPRPRRWVLGAVATAAAAAAAVVLLVALPREGFRARGTNLEPAAATAQLLVFRIPQGGTPEHVGSVINAGDRLAFSYVNPPPTKADHLLVFAVDQARHVYWFWPAWTSADTDPQAITIAAGDAPVELPEAVRHPLPPGSLTVHALFARRPYRVREIEAALTAGTLPTLDGVEVVQSLEVLP